MEEAKKYILSMTSEQIKQKSTEPSTAQNKQNSSSWLNLTNETHSSESWSEEEIRNRKCSESNK